MLPVLRLSLASVSASAGLAMNAVRFPPAASTLNCASMNGSMSVHAAGAVMVVTAASASAPSPLGGVPSPSALPNRAASILVEMLRAMESPTTVAAAGVESEASSLLMRERLATLRGRATISPSYASSRLISAPSEYQSAAASSVTSGIRNSVPSVVTTFVVWGAMLILEAITMRRWP